MVRKILTAAVILSLCAVPIFAQTTRFVPKNPITALALRDDWPQFHRTANNGAYNPISTITLPPGLPWQTTYNALPLTHPVVLGETLYAATESSGQADLIAIDTNNGNLRWSLSLSNGDIVGAPAVRIKGGEKQIFVGDGNTYGYGNLYCVIDKGTYGQIQWAYSCNEGPVTSNITLSLGRVYFIANDRYVVVLSAETGQLAGTFDTAPYLSNPNDPGVCKSTPAVRSLNGDVFVAGQSLYCVNASGQMRWEQPIDTPATGKALTPVLAYGNVYIVAEGGQKLFAFNQDNGQPVWDFDCPNPTNGFSDVDPVSSHGHIYCVSYDGTAGSYRIHCLNAITGQYIGDTTAPMGLIIGMGIDKTGTIMLGASKPPNDIEFFAIDKDTGQVLSSNTIGETNSYAKAPAITGDSMYFTTKESILKFH